MRIDYGFDAWLLRADIRIRNNIWDRLEFRANGDLGPINVTNHLRFNPRRSAFLFLRTAVELKISSDIELRARFLLTGRGQDSLSSGALRQAIYSSPALRRSTLLCPGESAEYRGGAL